MRYWIATRLRYLADRIDREHAIVCFPGYWNHTKHGLKVTVTDGIRANRPGVDLYYPSDQYNRAWIGFEDDQMAKI